MKKSQFLFKRAMLLWFTLLFLAVSFSTVRAAGEVDPTFKGGAFAQPTREAATVIRQPDGKILIGGNFTVVNGFLKVGIVRLNADGTLDANFNNESFNGTVRTLGLQSDGKIIVGGSFFLINNIVRRRIVRLTVNGALDTSFNTGEGADSFIQSLALQTDGKVLVGGGFSTFNNVGAVSSVRLLNDSTGRTPFDFDGDGRADVAVFRPSNGFWYQLRSQNNGFAAVSFGIADDKLVPADYDGDGKTDIAVFRTSDGVWYRQQSTNGQFIGIRFGQTGDRPTLGDFDGDGKFDIAVYRPSNNFWYRINSLSGQTNAVAFGAANDLIVPADYDGDGKADVAVFRNGTWYLNRSTQGFTVISFGVAGDKPIPNAFVQ